jgi:hypothetical protein
MDVLRLRLLFRFSTASRRLYLAPRRRPVVVVSVSVRVHPRARRPHRQPCSLFQKQRLSRMSSSLSAPSAASFIANASTTSAALSYRSAPTTLPVAPARASPSCSGPSERGCVPKQHIRARARSLDPARQSSTDTGRRLRSLPQHIIVLVLLNQLQGASLQMASAYLAATYVQHPICI